MAYDPLCFWIPYYDLQQNSSRDLHRCQPLLHARMMLSPFLVGWVDAGISRAGTMAGAPASPQHHVALELVVSAGLVGADAVGSPR